MSSVAVLAPDRGDDDEEHDLRNQTDDAAARCSHDQRDAHQSGNKDKQQFLFPIDGAGEQQSQRQRDSQFHVTGEVMTIDERTKRGALVQLTHPVDLRRARERLRQAEDREEETEDHDRPHHHVQSMRSEEHTSELQSQSNLVCRLLLEKKKKKKKKEKNNKKKKKNKRKQRTIKNDKYDSTSLEGIHKRVTLRAQCVYIVCCIAYVV